MSVVEPLDVVIAGGGVAAIEAALALRDLAGERVALKLIAPNAEFSYRPMTVREPFAYTQADSYSLTQVASDVGAELIVEEFGWVEAGERVAYTAAGVAVAYDALLLAVGARIKEAFAHVLTIDDRRMDELLHGVVQDVEEGYVKRIAFVAPARLAWPLPLYELALMTAARAYDMGVEVKLTLVTAEPAPLAVFGPQASDDHLDPRAGRRSGRGAAAARQPHRGRRPDRRPAGAVWSSGSWPAGWRARLHPRRRALPRARRRTRLGGR
jgi:sulfide:quinone oxidoreductase